MSDMFHTCNTCGEPVHEAGAPFCDDCDENKAEDGLDVSAGTLANESKRFAGLTHDEIHSIGYHANQAASRASVAYWLVNYPESHRHVDTHIRSFIESLTMAADAAGYDLVKRSPVDGGKSS